MAAQLAVLPTRNDQPAKYPHHGPRRARPYAYVPPEVGYAAASCADAVALQNATMAATARPTSSPEPAACAAGANAAKTPAPIIDPSPISTASPRPRRRASAGWEVTSEPYRGRVNGRTVVD